MSFSPKNTKKLFPAFFLVMIFFLGAALFSPSLAFASQKPQKGKVIDINLATQTLTRYKDGKALDSYKISSGKKSMPTPRGTFQVQNKATRAWSAEYELYMPYWMAFTPDGAYGIHELPEWPSGKKEGAAHLGTPVSHGCVRLGTGAAKAVYSWAPVGTPVVIH